MEKYTITDKILENNINNDIEFVTRLVAEEEINFQMRQLGMFFGPTEHAYNAPKLYGKLKELGFDVKGIETNFNVYVDKYKISFGDNYCQLEGFLEYHYPRLETNTYSNEGMIRILKNIPTISDFVKADIAYVKERMPIIKHEFEKKAMLKKMDQQTAFALLNDYFERRGYKYQIVEMNTKLHVNANLANGRKMEFEVAASTFCESFENTLKYIDELINLVKKEPFKIKIK